MATPKKNNSQLAWPAAPHRKTFTFLGARRVFVVGTVVFIALLLAGTAFFVKSGVIVDANTGVKQAWTIALASRIRQSAVSNDAGSDRRAGRHSVRVWKPRYIRRDTNLYPLRTIRHNALHVKHRRTDLGEYLPASVRPAVQRIVEESASSPAPAPSNIADAPPSGTVASFSTVIPPVRDVARVDGGVSEAPTSSPPAPSPTPFLGPFGSASAGEIRGGAAKPRVLVATYVILEDSPRDKFMRMECDYTEFLVRNRGEYAARHGYGYSVVTRNLETNRPLAWGKVRALQRWMGIWRDEWSSNVDGLPSYLDAAAADRASSGEGGVRESAGTTWDGPEWIFLLDADAFITNPDVRIEDLIDPDYDIILTRDFNNINSGTMLLKNGPWLADYWARIWDMTQYLTHMWWEQAAMIELMEDPSIRAHMKILDQRKMNSYPPEFPPPDGWWQENDFIVHFAGVQSFSDSFKKFGVTLREKLDFAGCARR